MKQSLRTRLRRAGVDVRRYREVLGYDLEEFEKRCRLLARHGVTSVVDVGANEGQWGLALRTAGFGGDILSLEPLERPFALLASRAEGDPRWRCERVALDEEPGTRVMHVAQHDAGSSLLAVKERLVTNTPQMATVGEEQVTVKRLDEIAAELPTGTAHMLKLDVQGAETQVLRSGLGSLDRFRVIEAELSFEPLYEGEATFRESIEFLASLGYELTALEPGIDDEQTGYPLQVDAFFVQADAVA
jgi:FkbM family methyltransferase